MPTNMDNRLSRLRGYIKSNNIEAVLISKPENRRYFSDFTGSNGILLITEAKAMLLTDFRYIEQAAAQATCFEVVRTGNDVNNSLAHLFKQLSIRVVGFESNYMTYDMYSKLAQSIDGVEFNPVQVDFLRAVKDTDELKNIEVAVAIADKAFVHIINYIKPGFSERQVALELEFYMRKLGSEKNAFDTIIASGVRGSLPHGTASEKIIESGDLVTMDFGAVYQGYHSDITRTIAVGKATAEQKHIYNIVLKAQEAGIKGLAAGLMGSYVDSLARNVIIEAGYGESFGHGLGHGVGLAIHEDPRLAPASTDTIIDNNMVVTVEPGIYIPEWGGVRIEDTVLVTPTGSKSITASSKQLIEI